jgi:hypothetical protein
MTTTTILVNGVHQCPFKETEIKPNENILSFEFGIYRFSSDVLPKLLAYRYSTLLQNRYITNTFDLDTRVLTMSYSNELINFIQTIDFPNREVIKHILNVSNIMWPKFKSTVNRHRNGMVFTINSDNNIEFSWKDIDYIIYAEDIYTNTGVMHLTPDGMIKLVLLDLKRDEFNLETHRIQSSKLIGGTGIRIKIDVPFYENNSLVKSASFK